MPESVARVSAVTGRGGGRPVIAIIGRPNAGKSTLFNRLTRNRRAVVDAGPGVTRDRIHAEGRWGERRFMVVDTGGLDLGATTGIEAQVRAQSEMAIKEADAVILLVDGRTGVAPADRDVTQLLRRSRKPFWLAVNKLDSPALDDDAADFFALGVERVAAISAAHGRGVAELLAEILAAVPAPVPEGDSAGARAIPVAIVGRPNVGKSSLLNRLVGAERSIVTPVPGTTRDAVDTLLVVENQEFLLVDTAGVRRRSRIRERLERAVAGGALRALERSRVAAVVVDVAEGVTDQDARIAAYAWERGRAVVIVVNKCDLTGGTRRSAQALGQDIKKHHLLFAHVPFVFVSARTGAGVDAVFPAVGRAAESHDRELRTAKLNQVISASVRATAPASTRGKRPTFQYAVQTGRRPPALTVFCSAPELVPEAYTRYLTNRLRASFELTGTPVRLHYRKRTAPPRRRGR